MNLDEAFFLYFRGLKTTPCFLVCKHPQAYYQLLAGEIININVKRIEDVFVIIFLFFRKTKEREGLS